METRDARMNLRQLSILAASCSMVRFDAHDLVVQVAVAFVGMQTSTLPKDHRAPGHAISPER
jgi:hypothetical protein